MARDTVRRAHLVRVGWLSIVIAVAIAPVATRTFATTLDWSTVQAGLAGVLFARCGNNNYGMRDSNGHPTPPPGPPREQQGGGQEDRGGS